MDTSSEPTLSRCLSDLLQPFEKLDLSLDDGSAYRQFRSKEPALVSCVDDISKSQQACLQVLSLTYAGENVGAISLVVQSNLVKKTQNNRFGRIDLVIVDPAWRGYGLGSVLVLGGLVHLLDVWGPRLYSISSLAAHDAISSILNKLGFHGEVRSGKDFVHEERKLAGDDHRHMLADLTDAMSTALQTTNYRLRQHQNEMHASHA